MVTIIKWNKLNIFHIQPYNKPARGDTWNILDSFGVSYSTGKTHRLLPTFMYKPTKMPGFSTDTQPATFRKVSQTLPYL